MHLIPMLFPSLRSVCMWNSAAQEEIIKTNSMALFLKGVDNFMAAYTVSNWAS